jgi:hypothetical protein
MSHHLDIVDGWFRDSSLEGRVRPLDIVRVQDWLGHVWLDVEERSLVRGITWGHDASYICISWSLLRLLELSSYIHMTCGPLEPVYPCSDDKLVDGSCSSKMESRLTSRPA